MLLLTLQCEQEGVGDRAIAPEPGMRVKFERNEDFLESTKMERARKLSKRADGATGKKDRPK